jgi:hypothetical protein
MSGWSRGYFDFLMLLSRTFPDVSYDSDMGEWKFTEVSRMMRFCLEERSVEMTWKSDYGHVGTDTLS